jgi:hypothetical protein
VLPVLTITSPGTSDLAIGLDARVSEGLQLALLTHSVASSNAPESKRGALESAWEGGACRRRHRCHSKGGFASKVAKLWQVIGFQTLLSRICVAVSRLNLTTCTRQGSNLQPCDPKLLGGAPNAGVRDSLHQSVKLTSNACPPMEEAKPSVWPARYMTTPFPFVSLACICPSIRVSPRLIPW